jgi:GTPase SAR1 family protein
MGKHAQLVMGPAGCGKSTYCSAIIDHCAAIGRSVHAINLDPAADNFDYTPSFDIRELISVDQVAEDLQLGPNGGLIYCMEYLFDNIEWFEEKMGDFADDYVILDCPGQIELYSHIPVMKKLVAQLQRWGYSVCGVFLIDALFMTDHAKFVAGSLTALSAMVQLELPHVNVLSKCDLIRDRMEDLEEFLHVDTITLGHALDQHTQGKFKRLNGALIDLLESYSMVNFLPLDIRNEDSIGAVLAQIDGAIQYGEDEEVKDTLRPQDDALERIEEARSL